VDVNVITSTKESAHRSTVGRTSIDLDLASTFESLDALASLSKSDACLSAGSAARKSDPQIQGKTATPAIKASSASSPHVPNPLLMPSPIGVPFLSRENHLETAGSRSHLLDSRIRAPGRQRRPPRVPRRDAGQLRRAGSIPAQN
jgi:hypothetical protein